jgi:hypothetical protein
MQRIIVIGMMASILIMSTIMLLQSANAKEYVTNSSGDIIQETIEGVLEK